jgi:O-antigen/teichoic acid export membrane protein
VTQASALARYRVGQASRALVDQVLSSGSQLLLTVLIARQTDPTTFGAVSVALIVHGFLLGVMRAAIGEVVLLRCRAALPAAHREASRGLYLALVTGVASAAGLFVVGSTIGGEVGHYLAIVAIGAPLVYAQDVLRYVAYGRGRVNDAILLDGVWVGVQVVVSAVLLQVSGATPTTLVLAWIAGAAVGAGVGAARGHVWPRATAIRRWFADDRARAVGFVSDYLVSNGLWQASFLVVGVVLSLGELAGLRAALVAVSPLGNVLAGVRILALAHLAGLEAHPARARQRAVLVALCLAGLAAAYGALLVVMPDDWGAELFGASWSKASSVVAIIAVAEVLRLPVFAAIDLIKVLGEPADLVRTRVKGVVVVVAAMMLGAIVGGPRGAALGTVVGYAWNQLVWWRRASAVSQRPEVPAVTVTA